MSIGREREREEEEEKERERNERKRGDSFLMAILLFKCSLRILSCRYLPELES